MLIAAIIMIAVGVVLLRAIARGGNTPVRPGPEETIAIGGAPILGRPDAPVVLVEFSDFECPVCARFSRVVIPALKRDYIGLYRSRLDTSQLDGLHL